MTWTFETLLQHLNEMQCASYRTEPERAEVLLETYGAILERMLELLSEKFDPN
jgi:hypothetical protein